MDTSINQGDGQRPKKRRCFGLFLLIGGGVLAYLFVISPLLAAWHHKEDVSIYENGVVLVPFVVISGLVLTLLGDDTAGQFLGRGNPFGLVATIITLGVGILLYEWLKSKLRAYGYPV
jgi:hypothetical protein